MHEMQTFVHQLDPASLHLQSYTIPLLPESLLVYILHIITTDAVNVYTINSTWPVSFDITWTGYLWALGKIFKQTTFTLQILNTPIKAVIRHNDLQRNVHFLNLNKNT